MPARHAYSGQGACIVPSNSYIQHWFCVLVLNAYFDRLHSCVFRLIFDVATACVDSGIFEVCVNTSGAVLLRLTADSAREREVIE
jgi:hypothetical protein